MFDLQPNRIEFESLKTLTRETETEGMEWDRNNINKQPLSLICDCSRIK